MRVYPSGTGDCSFTASMMTCRSVRSRFGCLASHSSRWKSAKRIWYGFPACFCRWCRSSAFPAHREASFPVQITQNWVQGTFPGAVQSAATPLISNSAGPPLNRPQCKGLSVLYHLSKLGLLQQCSRDEMHHLGVAACSLWGRMKTEAPHGPGC